MAPLLLSRDRDPHHLPEMNLDLTYEEAAALTSNFQGVTDAATLFVLLQPFPFSTRFAAPPV
jgi:hypothetical protein